MNDRSPERLTRSGDKMLGGVAGGIADYFDIDPTLVRLMFALAAIFGLPLVVPAYFVLWLVMPAPGSAPDRDAEGPPGPVERDVDRSWLLAIVLIAVGAIILMQELAFVQWLGWPEFRFSWPVLLILAGVVLLLAHRDRAVR